MRIVITYCVLFSDFLSLATAAKGYAQSELIADGRFVPTFMKPNTYSLLRL
ncbi:hypothetical protein [Aneurinibacillus sp. REN35]|uniref:hypothetical protein n=1 Tax=Aneurinibacillus sp. REN35 TaxID=3237286 RepID=UPI0035278C4C